MSGCHEPVKNTEKLITDYIDNCEQSFRTLKCLIQLNQNGVAKCIEWAEKFEGEINSIMGQIEGLSTHIEKVHDLVNLEDRITASDILNRLTLLEMSIHPDSTSPAISSLAERMRILEEFYNQQRNIISALETANGENSRQLIFIQEQDKQGFSWHKGQIEALAERIKSLEEHKNYQIDENRKVSKRMDVFEDDIHDLQVFKSAKLNQPHKCPVCDGLGGTKISGTIDEECLSCKGRGIVWG